VAPVRADLPAEVAGESVDGAADVSELLLGREAVDVPAVPQHPPGQRRHHQQGSWTKMIGRFITYDVLRIQESDDVN